MKNFSLKTKVVMILLTVVIMSGVGFSVMMFRSAQKLVFNYASTEAQNQIDRTTKMLMVTTTKFHQDFQKARESGKVDTLLALEDWSRTKTAMNDALSHDLGEGATRVRLIGDTNIFGIEPFGAKEKTGIQTAFEREAAEEIKKGRDRVEVLRDGYMRVAVPLVSQAHAGCAECHQGLRKGLDSDLKQNVILGTLNVYVPMQKTIAELRMFALGIVINIIILLMLVAAILYFFINRAVTTPIKKAMLFVQQISQGDLSGNLHFQQRDEIGILAESMNIMVENMRVLAQAAERISGGDLTVKFSVLSEKDTLGHSLKRMAEKLSQIISEIHLSASNVLSGSEQLSASSQAMSQGATEQASSLEEISSSMNEIASQTRQNSENATLASKIAGESRVSAEKGDLQTKDMVVAMNDISVASSNISKIIKIIDEIAFQTNLLALNAAVEAARAGKYGKGFAVVAEEVRNLAARSAKAAKETEQMIEGAVRKIEEGTSMASRTADALQEIVAAAGKVTDLVAEIAAASSEQAQGVSQITKGLSQVDQVTQQNTAHAEESASAAEELTGQAQMLLELVSTFTVSEDIKNRLETPRKQSILFRPTQIHISSAGRQAVHTAENSWGGRRTLAQSENSCESEPVIFLNDKESGEWNNAE